MTKHETAHFSFELVDSVLVIRELAPFDGQPRQLGIPAKEFGEALVGLGIVQAASVVYRQSAVAASVAAS